MPTFRNYKTQLTVSGGNGAFIISFVDPSVTGDDILFRGVDVPEIFGTGTGTLQVPAATELVKGGTTYKTEFEIKTQSSHGAESSLSDIELSGIGGNALTFQDMVSGAGLKFGLNGNWTAADAKAFLSELTLLQQAKKFGKNKDAPFTPGEQTFDDDEDFLNGLDGENSDGFDFEVADGPLLELFDGGSQLVPRAVDFGSGSTANPSIRHFSLMNLGSESATIRSISIAKELAAFSIPAIPATVLAPGESINFDVTFAPSGRVDYSGILSIDSNVDDYSGQFDLIGDGQPPNLPSIHVDFYNNLQGVQVGETAGFDEAELPKITNQGSAPLTITDIRVAAGQGSGEYTAGHLPLPITLAPGESTNIGVGFRPSKVGLRPGAFEVVSNDPTNPILRVAVVGTGVITHDGYRTFDGADLGNDYVAADANLSFENNLPELRTKSDDQGHWDLFLPAQTGVQTTTYDPVSGLVAHGSGYTNTGGTPTQLNPGLFRPSVDQDTDGDGLPDDVEFAIGTNPNKADTDGDGKNDFAELDSGQNPIDDRPAATGIVSALPVGDAAHDIALAPDFRDLSRSLAYVASGTTGLTVVDVTDFNHPISIAQLALAGSVDHVSIDVDRKLLAASSPTGGVFLIDISNPAQPILRQTIPNTGTDIAATVALYDGLVYAAVGQNLQAYSASSGEFSSSLALGDQRALGMTQSNGHLYLTVFDNPSNQALLRIIDITATGMSAISSTPIPLPNGNPAAVRARSLITPITP